MSREIYSIQFFKLSKNMTSQGVREILLQHLEDSSIRDRLFTPVTDVYISNKPCIIMPGSSLDGTTLHCWRKFCKSPETVRISLNRSITVIPISELQISVPLRPLPPILVSTWSPIDGGSCDSLNHNLANPTRDENLIPRAPLELLKLEKTENRNFIKLVNGMRPNGITPEIKLCLRRELRRELRIGITKGIRIGKSNRD